MRNSEGKRAIEFAQDNKALKKSSAYKLLSDAAPSVDNEAFFRICATGTSEEVKRAIENGANVNARNGDGVTPLMFSAVKNEDPGVIHALVRAGAKLDDTYKGGITALMLAATKNPNPEVIVALVNEGFPVNAKNEDDGTALMGASVGNPNPEIITALVKLGAAVNAQDKAGFTALMSAAQNTQNPAVLLALLNAGADAKIRNKNGKRAIDFASENKKLQGSEAYQKLLAMDPKANQARNNGRYSSSFIDLCKRGTPEEILNAIKAGADVNAKHPSGMTPLMFAAWQNSDARVIDVLLKAGADINAKHSTGATALIAAASDNPNPEVVIALLRAGADANVVDDKGKKAIDYAQSNKLLVGTAAFKMLEKASK
jgi:ankyrin repeat protein